ncbi:MAG TPA: beta-ketoacyl-ACP synthase II [Patescibacteria group bacterium]|nr:beta-ketoacyl-ACP synthase II [Patescibacteria group bacterium]
MTRDKSRVVITGVGVVAPNGIGREEFAAALRSGKSGIRPITAFDTTGLNSRIAGQAQDFDPEDYLGKKEVRRSERFVQMAVAAAQMALADASLDLGTVPAEDVGVTLGSGMGSFARTEKECKILFTQGAARISPTYMATTIPNIAAAQVAITLGLKGYLGTTVTACAAGTQAICEASLLLASGQAQVMFAGGTEANVSPLCMGSFCNMGALSRNNENPAGACRPFDRDRDGFVIAEGAGVVVLETRERAVRRGARIYAEIVGFGVTSDAYHLTAPDPEAGGMRRAMQRALARIRPEDIDYINAHGTGTALNDALETEAIKVVFGDRARRLAVSSTKSMIGHTLSAAGAIEVIATLLAMEQGFIPPTINYHHPDPACDLDYVPNVARSGNIRYALSNSFGFGGQNASIALGRTDH